MNKNIGISVQSLFVDIPVRGRFTRGKISKSGVVTAGTSVSTNQNAVIVRALEDVSLDIKPGDSLGIIGRNGSGKSTLLRVLAGLYAPTGGSIVTQGKIATLFSHNLGLDNDATGVENVFYAGSLLGLSKKEINNMLPGVIEFCQLGDFMDLPIRTYSSGMRTRLGFAIMTSIRPDILLVDEVFGAGDSHFRAKAEERIQELFAASGILVLCSHADALIQQFCQKTLWLHKGRVRRFGDTSEIMREYRSTKSKSISEDFWTAQV